MPEHTPKLPTIQKVEQHKPIDLSGQSKKALEIKSTIASIKTPIARSGVFTKMLESLTKMQQHLQKIRDFAAAKTDVKFNEKTKRWHSPLDSNKMVKGIDPRVVAIKEKAQEEAIDEDKERAERLPDDTMVTKKEVGLGNLAGFLKEIAASTKEHLELYKKEVGGDAEEDLKKDKKDEDKKKEEEEKEGLLKDIKDGIKENKVFGFFSKHWGKLLIGVGLLFLPLKDLKKWFLSLYNFVVQDLWPALKEIGSILLDVAVPALRMIFGAIGSMVDFFLGRRVTQGDIDTAKEAGPEKGESQEDFNTRIAEMERDKAATEKSGRRQGGMFGEGGGTSSFLQMFGVSKETAEKISSGLGAFATAIGVAITALAAMFPGKAIKYLVKGIWKMGKGLWKGAKNVITRLTGPKTPKGPKGPKTKLQQQRTPLDKRTATEQRARDAKAKQVKADRAAARGGGAKPTGTPKTGGALKSPPSPKPPTGKKPSLAGKAMKLMKGAGKKFPLLAKALPILGKIARPLGIAATVYALYTMINEGKPGKSMIPLIGSILGGIGGGVLGGMLGGLIGAAGGPLALITGAIGAVGGAMIGDSLAMGTAQAMVGEKVDAFSWPLDGSSWSLVNLNELLSGGAGTMPEPDVPKGGTDTLPETGGAIKITGDETGGPPAGGAPVVEKPPRTDFKVPDTGVTATSSESFTTGVDVGTKEEKIKKNIIKFVQIQEERFKKAKRKWAKKAIARKVSKHLRGPHRELVLEELKGTQLEEQIEKMAGGLKGPADLSKVAGAKGMLTPSGGLDMQSKAFTSHMGAGSDTSNIIPSVDPSDKTAGLNKIHSENAQLKGEQTGAGDSTMVNSPTTSVTNNNGTTMVLASNTAQGGMKLDRLIE